MKMFWIRFFLFVLLFFKLHMLYKCWISFCVSREGLAFSMGSSLGEGGPCKDWLGRLVLEAWSLLFGVAGI